MLEYRDGYFFATGIELGTPGGGSKMEAQARRFDFDVSAPKISELVRRIVVAADPIAVIAFGSRARGQHRDDSDLDLAVIVDSAEKATPALDDVTSGLKMSVDLLTISQARFDEFRPWINTVQRQIDREGIRLYERGKQPADRRAFERLC